MFLNEGDRKIHSDFLKHSRYDKLLNTCKHMILPAEYAVAICFKLDTSVCFDDVDSEL